MRGLRPLLAAAALWLGALDHVAIAQSADARPAPAEAERDDSPADDQQPQTVQDQLATLKRQAARDTEANERSWVRPADRRWRLRVESYRALQRKNIVMQQRDYSCGAACLATVARYYWGDDVGEGIFLQALDQILTVPEIDDRIQNGLAMSDLRRAAVKVGYQAVVGKTTFNKLTEAKVPLIVGIEPEGHKHFVVYRGTDDRWVYVADPIRGNVRMPIEDFLDQWQENAVLVIHKPGEKVKDHSPLSVTEKDIKRGELNWYLIRTQQFRQPVIEQSLP